MVVDFCMHGMMGLECNFKLCSVPEPFFHTDFDVKHQKTHEICEICAHLSDVIKTAISSSVKSPLILASSFIKQITMGCHPGVLSISPFCSFVITLSSTRLQRLR